VTDLRHQFRRTRSTA